MQNWLERMCVNAANRTIAFWALLTLLALLTVGVNSRYVNNFMRGPFPTTPEQLDAISDAGRADRFYIRVNGSRTIDTGIQQITTTTRDGVKESGRVTAGYFAVLVGNRFLIVKNPSPPNGIVEGELKTLPSELRTELSASLGADQVQKYIRPLLLDTEGFRYPGYWGIAAGLALLFCLFRYMRPALALRRDVSQSPVIQRVRSWGDLVSLAVEIEREYSNAVEYKSRGMCVTKGYVIENRPFSFNVLRFEDLIWAYKRVTQHRVNFIPTGKSYNAVMVFYGGSAAIAGGQKKVDGLLEAAAQKAPWATVGFSKELERAFKSDTDKFCGAVEMRRKELQQRASS
jgi:hypothetical protein